MSFDIDIPPIPQKKEPLPEILATDAYLFALLKTPIGKVYEFHTPLGQGASILARIRVQWSRIKSQLRATGTQLSREFKITSEIIILPKEGKDIVRLTRKMRGVVEFDLTALAEIRELLK